MFCKTMVRGLLEAVLVAAMLAGTAMADATLPKGLPQGSQYQILFITSDGTSASSSNIATYNSFVTAEANQSPTLRALGVNWTAVCSTTTFSASNATNTTNVPIYDTKGDLLEPSFGALMTSSSFRGPEYTQNGTEKSGYVWTGDVLANNSLGSKSPSGPLGSPYPVWGFDYAELGGSGDATQEWLCQDAGGSNGYHDPFYAISSPVTIVPEPSTLALLIAGAVGLLALAWRRKRMA